MSFPMFVSIPNMGVSRDHLSPSMKRPYMSELRRRRSRSLFDRKELYGLSAKISDAISGDVDAASVDVGKMESRPNVCFDPCLSLLRSDGSV